MLKCFFLLRKLYFAVQRNHQPHEKYFVRIKKVYVKRAGINISINENIKFVKIISTLQRTQSIWKNAVLNVKRIRILDITRVESK